MDVLTLTGSDLNIEDFYTAAHNQDYKIEISADAWKRIQISRESVETMIKQQRVAYGITTGFGSLKDCIISPEQLEKVQHNLIISHAAGTGNALPVHRVRGMLILRINTLIKGFSGVSVDLIEKLIAFFNYKIYSTVPDQGTVGASGDLAPLAHLVLGYLGYGKLWNPEAKCYQDANTVLDTFGFYPLRLKAKEGLALINGTQFITAHVAEGIYLGSQLLKQATLISALTLEALKGTIKPFDPRVSESRPHEGQSSVAAQMREYLQYPEGSERYRQFAKNTVQDAYSLRCISQVHGTVEDTLKFVNTIITTEMNSSTDNPLIFGNDVISGGNFHGQYPATAADFLAIAITTLGNISERRIERLMNSSLSKLPSFLIRSEPGVNSGCMILQYTAAALAAENRTLVYPASVTTIPTCENQEDHVSMGGFAARKLLQILDNVYHIVAIELFCAVQAYEMTVDADGTVIPTTPELIDLVNTVRAVIPAVKEDRYLAPEIGGLRELLKSQLI